MVTGPVCWVSNPNDWLESLPQPNRNYDLDPWIYRLLNSTHHLLNYTNLSLAKNCWLCLSPSLSQVLAAPMDSLGTLPGNILGLPLTRPDIARVKLTHSVPQCLQSLPGSRPLGKIPKELYVKITLTTDLTFCPQCSPFPGTYFVCGTAAYACLPPDWKGFYTLALQTPQISINPNNPSLPIPLVVYTRSKRAVQIIPLLVAMGITTGIGAAVGALPHQSILIKNYQKNFLMT
jgi:hypothetical protein